MTKQKLIKETLKQIEKLNDKIDVKIITAKEWSKEAKLHKSLLNQYQGLTKISNVKYPNFTFRKIK